LAVAGAIPRRLHRCVRQARSARLADREAIEAAALTSRPMRRLGLVATTLPRENSSDTRRKTQWVTIRAQSNPATARAQEADWWHDRGVGTSRSPACSSIPMRARALAGPRPGKRPKQQLAETWRTWLVGTNLQEIENGDLKPTSAAASLARPESGRSGWHVGTECAEAAIPLSRTRPCSSRLV
jgi:hypothetical protein